MITLARTYKKVEKNIFLIGNKFAVKRTFKGKKTEKSFSTLEKAREFRDSIIASQPKNKAKIMGDIAILYIPYNGEELEYIVDTELLPEIQKYTWHYSHEYLSNGRGNLHRFVTNAGKYHMVDHIDRNKRNNTRKNLRLVTATENMHNRGNNKNNTTGTRGLTYDKNTGYYQARMSYYGKTVFNKASKNKDALVEEFEKFKKEFYESVGLAN